MNNPAKVALFDIETAPNLGWVWGKWDQTVISFEKNWYMMSYSMKWLGQKEIHTVQLPDFPRYNYDMEDDKRLVKSLWKVLDEADVVIAHNGDKFDIRKANARFIAHGLAPPSPYKTIDTLKVARRYFKFDSNRLHDLGNYLGVGGKLMEHIDHKIWRKCMNGCLKSWKLEKKYNERDVDLLERVYLKMRPWMATHPDLDMFTRRGACPTCESPRITAQGFKLTKTGKRQQYKCLDCGGWHSSKIHIREVGRPKPK